MTKKEKTQKTAPDIKAQDKNSELNDPFYSEKNITHLIKGANALNNGEGVEHELVEDDV